MKKLYDGEFHFSPEENELTRVEPFYDEYRFSKEPERVIYDEYAQGGGRSDQTDGSRRARLKKILLMQAASVLAVASVVTAAAGVDPLGGATASPGGTSVVTPVTPAVTADDTAFPTLGNLDPDFAGNYAWSGTGTANSEEYVRFVPSGGSSYTFLVAGGAWKSMGAVVGTDPNAVYDKDSNTLTLTDFHASVLDMNLMGNGFTVKLEGNSSLDQLVLWGAMYGGSVTFTGDGTLTLNESGAASCGLLINGENSRSCVIVKKGVKLDIYGSDAAVMILDTTMDPAIYVSDYLTLTGGEISGATNANGYYDCTVVAADGAPATRVTIE